MSIAGSEIVGLVPKKALELTAAHYLKVENFSSSLILEDQLLGHRLDHKTFQRKY